MIQGVLCRVALMLVAFCAVNGLNPTESRADDALRVVVEEGGASVMIGDDLFARYNTSTGGRPSLWPVNGPTGDAMTRAYPLSTPGEHEESDHIHHTSFWFGYEGVNGFDFWHTVELERGRPFPIGFVRHREFARADSTGDVATIVTRNDWTAPDGKVVAHDERLYNFGVDGDDRWIEVRLDLWSSDGPLKLGDTKEGFFAYRVPGTMKVDARMGGKIVNAEGLENDAAWGKPSTWVDYTGPVDGETLGVAILTHPESHNASPRWHVRPYGLFAANPFGSRPYRGEEPGGIEVGEGERVRVRYRVILHHGDTEQAQIAEKFAEYASDRR